MGSVQVTSSCWACGGTVVPDRTWQSVQLHRCERCGLLFTPERTPEELRSLYGADYFANYPGLEDYAQDTIQRDYEARVRVRFVQRYCAGGQLLEIGAAAGHFLVAAGAAGFEAVGIEPAGEVAERARQRFGVDIRQGFAEDLPFPPGSFDVACAWHVVEHVANPADALVKVRDLLRPGGYLILEVPNIESVYARSWGERWVNLDLAHHVAHYGPTSMEALLTSAGYTTESMETFPSLGYVNPRRAMRPMVLGAQLKELLTVRALPRHSHPSKHEMLRAVARTPA
jgi:2-polyprenyl-3-methyl-5-hydroxy-6-metoxy-1,4-benzoquinol methylase